jgi:flavorubredoxin
MQVELKPGIVWTGHVDWTVRNFHGYLTERGSSYNAYLIRDERSALIDAVKAPYAGGLVDRVRDALGAEGPAYVVCNHAEPDHSGGLTAVMRAFPRAELVCDAKCREALRRHYDTAAWRFKVVADGETLPLGRYTLQFFETPMVHWPESMFTYVPEVKLLFSMDAFGQHLASARRFDDENALDTVLAEAKTYYANIVMLYGNPIARTLDRASGLAIDMIAPSHGVIWRSHADRIMEAYRRWVAGPPEAKVLVFYDSMWNSTETMAHAIVDGVVEDSAVDARLYNVRETHSTTLATEILDAACVAVGSPTLNTTLMPEVAKVLTYLKGLKPRTKAALAFGSYGWSTGGARDVAGYLDAMKFEQIGEPLQAQFVPDAAMLDACRAAGRELARRARAAAAEAV